MATGEATGMAHLTVIPENFESTADGEGGGRSDGVVERADADGADSYSRM